MKDLIKEEYKNDYSYIESALVFIENNLEEDICIKDICKNSKVSKWHFQRRFKELTGEALGTYLKERRLTEAAKTLRSTNLPIIEVAYSIGYNSHEAFSRAFKKHFNITPSKFKEEKCIGNISFKFKPIYSNRVLNLFTKNFNIELIQEKRQVSTTPPINHYKIENLLNLSVMQIKDIIRGNIISNEHSPNTICLKYNGEILSLNKYLEQKEVICLVIPEVLVKNLTLLELLNYIFIIWSKRNNLTVSNFHYLSLSPCQELNIYID